MADSFAVLLKFLDARFSNFSPLDSYTDVRGVSHFHYINATVLSKIRRRSFPFELLIRHYSIIILFSFI